MLVEDALKPTGKAVDHRKDVMYAELDVKGVLCWYDVENNEFINPVGLESIGCSDWQPYHEVKEIRPEKAGELWSQDENNFVFINHDYNIGALQRVFGHGGVDFDIERMVHNKNGWTRLYPPVEDENVERIEIEGVRWKRKEIHNEVYFYPDLANSKTGMTYFQHAGLTMKTPMKMIFEIPKDKP